MTTDAVPEGTSIADATTSLVFDPVARANPYPVYDLMRSTDPSRVVIQNSVGRAWFTERSRWMLWLDPPDHTGLRIADQGEADFLSAVAFELPITIICDMLGVPLADYFHEFRERRREPGSDLIDGLIAAEEEGQRLTEDEIVSTAGLLVGAGFETTTNLLGNGMLALLRHPDHSRLLCDDPDLAPGAFEELLRFDSPVQMATPRVANAEVEAAGHMIAPGDVVVAVVAAGNRDPARFDDPNAVNLQRPDPDPLSFGGGPHCCLGAGLARMEGAVAFAALARQVTVAA